MNERDESLLRHIMRSIDDGLTGPVLLDVSSTQFVRMNLILLKGLLEERRLSGIFISVDRPHQYMVHLLRMHKIKLDNIIFVDAISRFSGDRKEAVASVGFVDAPFHIDRLPEAMQSIPTSDGKKIDMDGCDFAMIDNLAALLPYNSYASVESFLRKFVGAVSSSGVLVPLVVDRDKSGLLYETARSLSVKEICLREPLPVRGGPTAAEMPLPGIMRRSD